MDTRGEDYGGIQDGLNIFPSLHAKHIKYLLNLENDKFGLLNMRTISPETILEKHP